jgi:hypothetical protein
MDVVYAAVKEADTIVDGGRYRVHSLTEATTSLERKYTLFVVTPDEVKWRKHYDTWKDRYVFIGGSIVMLLIAAFWLFMAYPQLLKGLIEKSSSMLIKRKS